MYVVDESLATDKEVADWVLKEEAIQRNQNILEPTLGVRCSEIVLTTCEVVAIQIHTQ